MWVKATLRLHGKTREAMIHLNHIKCYREDGKIILRTIEMIDDGKFWVVEAKSKKQFSYQDAKNLDIYMNE